MPFVRTALRPIPERLFHYTSGESAESILKSGRNHGEICFWAKNAICKNDKSELDLGRRMYESVHEHLLGEGRHSLLDVIEIDPTLVFMNSFTENDQVNEHMLDLYGYVRLEFDFRRLNYSTSLRECDYILDDDLMDLSGSYCKDFDEYMENLINDRKDLQSLNQYLCTEMGVITSIPYLKHLREWGVESEWRHVLHMQPQDKRVFSLNNLEPRMKVYYPSRALTGITCFYSSTNENQILPCYNRINHLVCDKKWSTKIAIIALQD